MHIIFEHGNFPEIFGVPSFPSFLLLPFGGNSASAVRLIWMLRVGGLVQPLTSKMEANGWNSPTVAGEEVAIRLYP